MILNFKSNPVIAKTERNINANEINTSFQINLCPRFIEFWQFFKEITFENGINMYGFAMAEERNKLYEVTIYAPDYLLIGDNGGGQGLFLKKNNNQLNVYYQDLGALSSPFYFLHMDLFSWLENNPTINEEDFWNDELDLLDKVNVYIVRVPTDVNKFIIEMRKCFNLKLSINDIKQGFKTLPFLAIQNITLMKYGKIIELLNQKYNCLEVINSDNVIIFSPVGN